MADNRQLTAAGPEDLDWYVNWGGHAWKSLTCLAITDFLGTDNLRDKRLLDIGARDGKMSLLFARLGARVTGIDVCDAEFELARSEARRLHVEETTEFVKYDGCLSFLPKQSFDIVFTKSVLVLIEDLESFAAQISEVLKPDGRVVLIENARGNVFHQLFRSIRDRRWHFGSSRLFTRKQLEQLRNVFEIDRIKTSRIRPVYLIVGHKPQHG